MLVLCGLALVGFAANSLLARGALGAHAIDASSYTLARLVSGAIGLWVLHLASQVRARPAADPHAHARAVAAPMPSAVPAPSAATRWTAAASLTVYAAAFSFAYLRIGAALGALVLFPTVKTALLVAGHRRGERPRGREWLGALLSVSGLVALTAPGASRPDLPGVLLMALAGLAWAAYTLAGRTTATPLVTTRDNFARATIISVPLLAGGGHATPAGLGLAALSGAVTSAIPYVIWYRVVPHLTGMQLGLAQLSVPVLASAGAVALLGEPVTARLVCGALLIGGGVLVATAPNRGPRRR